MTFTYKAHATNGIRLNANESSLPPANEVMETFVELLKSSELNRYPDDFALEMRQAFAALYGLDAGQVIAGNGSDALLQLMITTFCRGDKSLVMLVPDFGMYRFYADSIQTKTFTYPTAWDGSFDLDDFAAFAKAKNAGLVLISNPNNPTGHLLDADTMLLLAKKLDPIVLAADEAYMNFADESLLARVNEADNLIVSATLSKAWGAAGIRVGFLAAGSKLIEAMDPFKIVYSISSLDQLAARAVLAHPEITKERIAAIKKESDRIEEAVRKMKRLEAGEFNANFYALRTVDGSEIELENDFKNAGIQIRDYPDHARVRITIGLAEENDAVLSVLEAFDARDNENGKEGECHA